SPPPALSASFTSPAAGATVSGTVAVGMSASGGTAPYTYTLTLDGSPLTSGGATTYSWSTTTASNGGHTLGLTVRDNIGATATASRTVTVQNGAALSAAITAPANGATVSGPWSTSSAADGAQTLTASARDATGNTGVASIAITVANGGTPPPPPPALTASFTSPAAGATVSGTVSVGMSASGGTAPYTYTLTIDGSQVASSASATYSWSTTSVADGSHTLGLTVTDGGGRTATASRPVTV